MNTLALLATSHEYIDVAVSGIGTVDLNWIGNIIKWLFDLFAGVPGAIGLGAIIFTLFLKTIVLPLDVYSRVKMKKQSLVMEKMRPQMEKLQKQYANDKNMYNQKVLELQKAHGYNPLSACLPTIISLVIFMVVFSAFSTYSQYANLSMYNNMTEAYSTSVQQYVYAEGVEDPTDNKYFLIAGDENFNQITPKTDKNGNFVDDDGKPLKITGYFIDYDKFAAYYTALNGADPFAEAVKESAKNEIVVSFVREGAQAASAEYYRKHRPETSFLWIGNLWYPDSMFNKEVPSFSEFSSAISRAAGSVSSTYEASYNEVTQDLGTEKNTWNGYFVLIVLSIGFMFLQQFITMRSQKAANELSSVDGSGARTNKMMMILMPIIFGIFSFMYSAAFSIYMIMNTVYSLISTLIINKLVSMRFEKKQQNEEMERVSKRASGGKRLN